MAGNRACWEDSGRPRGGPGNIPPESTPRVGPAHTSSGLSKQRCCPAGCGQAAPCSLRSLRRSAHSEAGPVPHPPEGSSSLFLPLPVHTLVPLWSMAVPTPPFQNSLAPVFLWCFSPWALALFLKAPRVSAHCCGAPARGSSLSLQRPEPPSPEPAQMLNPVILVAHQDCESRGGTVCTPGPVWRCVRLGALPPMTLAWSGPRGCCCCSVSSSQDWGVDPTHGIARLGQKASVCMKLCLPAQFLSIYGNSLLFTDNEHL